MNERNTIRYQNNHAWFSHREQPSPPIDSSWLEFKIPSAQELYHTIIWRDKFELVSKSSLNYIMDILLKKGYDISQLSANTGAKKLSWSLNHYIFYFNNSDDRSEQEFIKRRKLVTELLLLRYQEINQNDIILDATTPLQLHISSTESYTFSSNENKNDIPNYYRALCIYDKIVVDLYLHNDNQNYINYLITDYLSIHIDKYDEINSRMQILRRLSECLEKICCDRHGSDTLMISFRNYSQSQLAWGHKTIIPLTKSAYPENKSPSITHDKLNKYSHKYCELIQYRYLLDLELLFSSVTNENVNLKRNYTQMVSDYHSDSFKLKNESERVKREMKRWDNFKYQPMVLKCESLVERIYEIGRISRKCNAKLWSSCYWEEGSFYQNEQQHKVIYIYAINRLTREDLFSEEFCQTVQKEITLSCNGKLRAERHCYNSQGNLSYFLSFKQQDLANYPLRQLLSYSDQSILHTNNIRLSKLTLSKQSFFETKKPKEWLNFLEKEKSHSDELEDFIWKLATWATVREWLHQHTHEALLDGKLLPTELFPVIVDLLAMLLKKQNGKDQNSQIMKM